MGTQKSESIFLYFSHRERIKVTGKDNQRQGLSGYSAGPLACRACHEIGFIGCHRYNYGKHGPIGAQRPLIQMTHTKKPKTKNTNVSSLPSRQSQVSSAICDRGTTLLFMFISLIFFIFPNHCKQHVCTVKV